MAKISSSYIRDKRAFEEKFVEPLVRKAIPQEAWDRLERAKKGEKVEGVSIEGNKWAITIGKDSESPKKSR